MNTDKTTSLTTAARIDDGRMDGVTDEAVQMRRKGCYVPQDPLLSIRGVAAELSIGVSTAWKYLKEGRIPRPVYIAPNCPRWRRSALHAAINNNAQ